VSRDCPPERQPPLAHDADAEPARPPRPDERPQEQRSSEESRATDQHSDLRSQGDRDRGRAEPVSERLVRTWRAESRAESEAACDSGHRPAENGLAAPDRDGYSCRCRYELPLQDGRRAVAAGPRPVQGEARGCEHDLRAGALAAGARCDQRHPVGAGPGVGVLHRLTFRAGAVAEVPAVGRRVTRGRKRDGERSGPEEGARLKRDRGWRSACRSGREERDDRGEEGNAWRHARSFAPGSAGPPSPAAAPPGSDRLACSAADRNREHEGVEDGVQRDAGEHAARAAAQVREPHAHCCEQG